MGGAGNHIRIPVMLKQRWHKAICTAPNLRLTRDAIIAVTVVPMFAPRVKGSIFTSGSTPIAQSGVNAEVVTELDWTRIVTPRPISNAK